MMDSLCLCQFVWGPAWQLYGPDDLVLFCKYGAGWETSIAELQEIGERRINMMRLYNAREGFGREHDVLPDRMFIPIPDGPNAGVGITKEAFEAALNDYYAFAGWDPQTGIPTQETKKRLGLEWIL
jgi:aldehyde:ferredoxin oxidoreductase